MEVNAHFRAPLLLAVTWFAWGINVLVFRWSSIHYARLLGFDQTTLLSPLSIACSALVFLAVILLAGWAHGLWGSLVVPGLLYLLALWTLLLPLNTMHRTGRERLLFTFGRVLCPAAAGVTFVDVLLGDVLTSLCKVLADAALSVCVLVSHFAAGQGVDWEHVQNPGSVPEAVSTDDGGGTVRLLSELGYESMCEAWWVRPLVTSVPFLLRLRQCVHQYRVQGGAFPNLVNATKYLSSLPVIWLSALLHVVDNEGNNVELGVRLHTVWVLAISFNSFFSFMWDVCMDWGLSRGPSQHFLLRDTLLYPSPMVYYVAMAIDFLLRVLWSFKLSAHLHLSGDSLLFVLEVLEVLRRMIWILFRVEWEQVSKGEVQSNKDDALDTLIGMAEALPNGDGKTSVIVADGAPGPPLLKLGPKLQLAPVPSGEHGNVDVATGQGLGLAWPVIAVSEPLRNRTVSERIM